MTSLSSEAVTEAARLLLSRRAAGTTGPLLPVHCRPGGPEDGLAIQAALMAQSGERIGGWKCAMPDGERLIAAPVPASLIHRAEAPCPVRPGAGQARVEPELAFLIGQDLPPRAQPYSDAEVGAAIAASHLALELIGSRYEDPDHAAYPDHLADCLLNQGIVIGPAVDAAQAASATTLALQVRCAGQAGADRDLDGRHPAGAPRAPLFWLVEFLRARGQGLQAGQFVITGSFAGCLALPLATPLTLRYGELGTLAVTLTPG